MLSDWSWSWKFFLMLAGGGLVIGLTVHYVGFYFWGFKRFVKFDEV